MSSFALKGFVTGLAKGALAQFDKEKEETEENIKLSVKNAYENMSKYKSVVEKQQEDIKERDRRIMQFAPDLEDSYRIAAATMPDLLTVYQTLLDRGQRVNIRDLIQVGEQAKGLKFDTWVNGLKNLQTQQQQVGAFIAPKEDSFFAPSAESQQRMSERLSKSLGTTTEELAQFKTEQTTPSLTGYGSFTPKFLDKMRNVPSLPQQLQDAVGRVGELTLEYGEDSEQVKEASIIVNKLKGVKDQFSDPKEQSWTARLDSLNLKLLGEKDPAKRSDLKAQIREWVNINELSQGTDNPIVKPLTYSQYYSQWAKAAQTYFGNTYGKDFLTKNISETLDGKYTYVGNDPNIKERTQKEMKTIALSSLRQYITNGKPINLELQNFLENIVGVQFLTPQQVEEYRRAYNSEKGANISTEEATQQLIDSGRMISITGR